MVGPSMILANSYDLSVPGDQTSCHASAKELRALAQTLGKVHEHQTSDAALSHRTLGGETGQAFRKGAADVSGPIHDLRAACHAGAGALDQLGWDMKELQHKVDHLKKVAAGATNPFIAGDIMTMPQVFLDPTDQDVWNHAIQLYDAALAYQNGAQKAFVEAIQGDDSAVSPLLFPAGSNTQGYHPAPHPHHHSPHHPGKKPGSPDPTATGSDRPGGTGSTGDTGGDTGGGVHLRPHGQASDQHGKHHLHAVFEDDEGKHDVQPITAVKHAHLEQQLRQLEQQSSSLQHRIDVLQQAIEQDPTNVDNPLLQQEVGFLDHQLDQHQHQITSVTEQLSAPVIAPHHHGGTGFALAQLQPEQVQERPDRLTELGGRPVAPA